MLVELREVYRSWTYEPGLVDRRYVRCDSDGAFRLFEVGACNGTLREADIDPSGLPVDVVEKARALVGYYPSMVRL